MFALRRPPLEYRYQNVYRSLAGIIATSKCSGSSRSCVLPRFVTSITAGAATIARTHANGREIEGERMSDRPQGLDTVYPRRRTSARVIFHREPESRESARASGRYLAKLKNYSRILAFVLAAAKKDEARVLQAGERGKEDRRSRGEGAEKREPEQKKSR